MMLHMRSLGIGAVLLGGLLAPTPAHGQTTPAHSGLVVENQNSPDYDGYGGTPFGQLFIYETKWTPIWPLSVTSYTYVAVVYCRFLDESTRPPTWGWDYFVRTGTVTKRDGHYVLPYPFGANAGGVMDIVIAEASYSQTGSKASGGDMGIPFSKDGAPDVLSDAAIARLPVCPD